MAAFTICSDFRAQEEEICHYFHLSPPLFAMGVMRPDAMILVFWKKNRWLSLTVFQNLPKFMSIALVMPSSHLILWSPLFLLSSIFPSIRDSSSEPSVLINDQNTGDSLRHQSFHEYSMNIQGWSPLRLTGLANSYSEIKKLFWV